MRIALLAFLVASVCACDFTRNPAPDPERNDWSCAAYCVTSYSCSSNGDSSIKYRLVTSEGRSAATAFTALVGECSGSNMLATYADCTDGKYVATGASLASSCARD